MTGSQVMSGPMRTIRKGKAGLRKGFTTGACAAAAAKAAAYLLITEKPVQRVEIALPAGGRARFDVHRHKYVNDCAETTVIKDAGDDPDVTNGAEIGAEVTFNRSGFGVVVRGGRGVGTVTKPGLPVPVGQPAINPIPMKMIKDELCKVLKETGCPLGLDAVIFVTDGEKLAKRTLNHRLGILGGISILGTTGIVEPISTKAWTDTIVSAMGVARACGVKHLVLTPGRTSESAAMEIFGGLPEEAFVQMGDHVGFALEGARDAGFRSVSIVAQFGKLVKVAMGSTKTHVKDSALEIGFLADLALALGYPKEKAAAIRKANTAREVFFMLREGGGGIFFDRVREMACRTASGILGDNVGLECMLVDYEGKRV